MDARFEIVSLRKTADDSLWLALILEGERLGQFRFVSPQTSAEQTRGLIHTQAHGFSPAESALDQFRALEQSRAVGDAIRRVIDVSAGPPLAAAA